jgi:hypothetical protein
MKKILILTMLIFVFNACKRSDEVGCQAFGVAAPPKNLYFLIKQNSQRLDDNTLNSIKLFYFLNSAKTYVQDFQRAGDQGYNLGVLASQQIGFNSADTNIKDYFLEFSTGDIDTLFVDYRHYTQCQADTSSCHCIYPRILVKYNGQIATYDPTITQQTVYLFNKQ